MKESTSQSLPGVGDVFLGKYRIERVLGAGGFGTVFAARHIGLDHKVAIKVLRAATTSTDAASTTAVERFVREARLAAKIESEHVARVHDVARMSDGSAYMVMEYLEGRNLQVMLAEDGPLPIAKAIDFTLQTCAALEAAHGIGVVHRDVKPANLFCVVERRRQVIKLIDFGIARWRGATASPSAVGTLTSSLAMMGSPRYMAPEQLTSSRDVDARADIWSLGVTLFELLANAAPFTAQNLAQLCARIQSDAPRSLRSFRPDVTPEIERVVARCLEKLPDDRFASVHELAIALGKKGPDDEAAEETKQHGPRRATNAGSPVIKVKVEEEEDGEGPTVAAPQYVALPLRAPALDEIEEPTRDAPTRRLAAAPPSSPARRASAVLVAVSIVSIGRLALVVGARLVKKTSSPIGPPVPSLTTSPPTTAVVVPSPMVATSLLVAPPVDSPSLPAMPVVSAAPRVRASKPRPSTATSSRLPDDRE